ncbi:hypothetical protein LL06_12920 [Hoeflea sp. BAL378]|nr:hypothetical protein LL06_12920 [Hoeflea sp. BAL378]
MPCNSRKITAIVTEMQQKRVTLAIWSDSDPRTSISGPKIMDFGAESMIFGPVVDKSSVLASAVASGAVYKPLIIIT